MLKSLSPALVVLLVAGCGPAPQTPDASNQAVALQTELPAPSTGPYRIEVGPVSGAGPWVLVSARDGGNQLDITFDNGGIPEIASELSFADQDRRHIWYVSRQRGEVSDVQVTRAGGPPTVTLSRTTPLAQSSMKPDAFPWDGSAFPHTYDPSTLTAVKACTAGSETGTLWRAAPPGSDIESGWEACVTADGIALPSPFHIPDPAASVTLRVVRGPVDPTLFDPANALRLVSPAPAAP